MVKGLAYYMSLLYPITMIPEEDGSWFVEVPLLKGCMSVGNDWNHAREMITEAKQLWLEVSLESGLAIPEPEIIPGERDDPNGEYVRPYIVQRVVAMIDEIKAAGLVSDDDEDDDEDDL